MTGAGPAPEPNRLPPAFEFDDVVVEAGGRRLLDGVTAAAPARSVTVVTGPSGSGKTTLLRLCNRLDVAARGRVRHHGVDVAACDPLELRRRVGMVFQQPVLFPGTVRDNLAVARAGAGEAGYRRVLERVGLGGELLGRTADTVSGGEAQRLCLARTLLTEPDALLLDEPTSALDERPRLAFERLVAGLVAAGVSVLWVTHDLEQVRRVADEVIVLAGGRVVCAGPPRVLDDPVVAAVVKEEH